VTPISTPEQTGKPASPASNKHAKELLHDRIQEETAEHQNDVPQTGPAQ